MTKAEIDDFFATFVTGFIFHDIEATIRAKANFGVALMMLDYTEILGALASGQLGIRGVSSACFDHGLSLMSWNGDKKFYRDFLVDISEGGRPPRSAAPYEIFRCGLAHEYFVKGLGTVINNPDDPQRHVPQDQGIGWIDYQGRRVLCFHTNAYYRDLRAAFLDFWNDVTTNSVARGKFVQSIQRIGGRTVSERK